VDRWLEISRAYAKSNHDRLRVVKASGFRKSQEQECSDGGIGFQRAEKPLPKSVQVNFLWPLWE